MSSSRRLALFSLIAAPVLDAISAAWALLSPVACAGCGSADRALCAACRTSLTSRPERGRLPGGQPVWSALHYDGRVRRAILAFKEQGRTDIARSLAPAFADAVRCAIAGRVELVAVPSRRASRYRRGYDPVAALLAAAGLRSARGVLVRVRRSELQKSLTRAARSENSAGSLRARGSLVGRRLVIVDDVVTTGSTLAEAARAIEAAGGLVVGAAVLAATPRRYPGRPAGASMEAAEKIRRIAQADDDMPEMGG